MINNKSKVKYIAFVFCAFTTSVLAFESSQNVNNIEAQQTRTIMTSNLDDTSGSIFNAESDTDVETIDIEGIKPLRYYEKQLELAELDFYDLYNSLADEEKFKMICRRDYRVGTRIRQISCYPQYFLQRYANETQDAWNNTTSKDLASKVVRNIPTYGTIEFLTAKTKKEALTYVEKLVEEHPELLRKLLKMENARVIYEEKRNEK